MTNPAINFPTFTVTVTAKGREITFTSKFETLAEAFHSLKAHVEEQAQQGKVLGFAGDLLVAAQERRLSPKQAAWLHKLATDAATPRVSRQDHSLQNVDLTPILDLLKRAAAAQKRNPRIRLETHDYPVVLTLAGDRSSRAGTANITDGKPYGENIWFGRIESDGSLTVSSKCTVDIIALLRALAADPSKVAGQHGVATGNCCFCGIDLSTAESRSVGYGPICADKYGLPWGDTSVADAADAAAKAAVEVDESPQARAAGR